MTRPAFALKTGLLLAAGALFLATAQPAFAQSSGETGQFLNRLNQLENQVQTLSRALFRGEKPADAGANVLEIPAGEGAGAPSAAGFETRLSQIEEQQRALTGQLEKLGFDLQQMKSHLERMQADIEQRFQQQAGGAPPVEQAPTPLMPSESGDSPGGVLGTIPAGEGSSAAVTADTLYEESFTFIRDAKYDQAESGFKQFLERYPDHALASNAQYWLGETYYVRGDYKQSAKMFAQGYQSFPKSSKARDSLLKLGLSLSKLGKKDDACLSLRQLEKEVYDEANPLRRRAVQEIKQLGCP